MPRAPLVEIFSSVQGEGRHVGVPMTFLRLGVCPLRCRYCDTPESHTAAPRFDYTVAGARHEEANPVTAARAVELVGLVAGPVPAPVSVTGGEPLLYPDFVRACAVALRAAGRAVHLETAALHPDALAAVVDVVDHLSADYKLPGTLESGDPRPEHLACVAHAVGAGRPVDVKLVLTREVSGAAFESALEALHPWRGEILLVLQPVTPFGGQEPPLPETRQRFLDTARGRGFRVLLLPQVHRLLGLR